MLLPLRTSRPFPIGAQLLLSIGVTLAAATANPAQAQNGIAGWGIQVFDNAWHEAGYIGIAGGSFNTLALRSDGTLRAWGSDWYGESSVPPLPPGLTYVEVGSGRAFSVARRSDGSVVAWGTNGSGQCNVPALPAGLPYEQLWVGLDCVEATVRWSFGARTPPAFWTSPCSPQAFPMCRSPLPGTTQWPCAAMVPSWLGATTA